MENTEQEKDNFAEFADRLSIIEHINNNNIQEAYRRLEGTIANIRNTKETLFRDNNTLKIGVVGQVKAGKSSFLNSLFFDGEDVLPKASTPMTAGLTILEYSEKNEFLIEYYSKKEWTTFEDEACEFDRIISEFKAANPDMKDMSDDVVARIVNMDIEYSSAKELVSKCSDIAKMEIQETAKTVTVPYHDLSELQSLLENYIGVSGRYTPIVKCLTLKLNDERLKNIQIVDTPGVNDPVLSREQRTREFLRACHGVFFLSYSSRFFDSTDTGFLVDRIGSQGIGTVILIASKFDSVLQDVGVQFKNRLGAAIKDCQEKLHKQFINNLRNSDFKGPQPAFDVSSGIGFSISKKDTAKWDSMERHVVERMRTYFPDNFSSDEKAKETFLALSQMDVMKEKYLEGVFLSNKQKIIDEKVSAYMASASNQFSNELKHQIDVLSTKKGALENSTISELSGKKESMEKIIGKISNNLENIFTKTDDTIDKNIKDSLNSLELDWTSDIPTKKRSKKFSRKTTWFGNNTEVDITYDAVDYNNLIDELLKVVYPYLNTVYDSWKGSMEKLNENLTDELCRIVTESETQDNTGHFDADTIRGIISSITASMSKDVAFEITPLRTKSARLITDFFQMNKEEIEVKVETENESDLIARVQEMASKKIVSTKNEIRTDVFDDIHKLVKEQLIQSRDDIIRNFKDNKDRIIKDINDKTRAYLENLRTELENKEHELDNYNTAINTLETLLKY